MRLSLKAKTHNYLQNLQTETFRTCILMRKFCADFSQSQYFYNLYTLQ